jgi:hypothetical protein
MTEKKPTGLVYQQDKNWEGIVLLSRQQNRFIVKSMFLGIFLILLIFIGMASITYYFLVPFFSQQQNIQGQFFTYKTDMTEQFQQQVGTLQEVYQKNYQNMYEQGQQGYKDLLNFLLQLQQDYEDKILAGQNREKDYQTQIDTTKKNLDDLRKSFNHTQLELIKLENDKKTAPKNH